MLKEEGIILFYMIKRALKLRPVIKDQTDYKAYRNKGKYKNL